MTTAADLLRKPPKIILYGPPGDGKTALAMTLGKDALMLDADEGLTTAITLKDKFTNDRLQVECKQFIEEDIAKKAVVWTRFKAFVETIPSLIKRKDKPFSEGGFPFKALIIDSLTSFGEACSKYIVANNGNIGQAPEIQHWKMIANDMSNVISVLRPLPIIVVLIAHDEERPFGKIGTPAYHERVSIAVPTKALITRIPRFFDEIWYTKCKQLGDGEMEYYLHTRKDDAIIARSRLGIHETTYAKVKKKGNVWTNVESVGLWDILKATGIDKEKINV